MLWQDTAFLVTAGAGSLFSLAHYVATASSISAPVPLHFNMCGAPDRFAAPWAFALYPLISVVLGASAAVITLPATAPAALTPNSLEQLTARAAIVMAYVGVLASQLYAKPISDGTVSKLPSFVMGALYGGLGIVLTAAIASKYVS